MEPPPLATRFPQNSNRKRLRAASFMDADVIEIPPPAVQSSNSKALKKKEVMCHEIIDVDDDEDEDFSDLAVFATEVSKVNKGKAILDISDGYLNGQAEEPLSDDHLGSVQSINGTELPVQEELSYGPINIDGHIYFDDDDYMDYIFADDMVKVDEYDQLQAHFDNMDIPPGVEAPVPWLSDLSKCEKKPDVGSSSDISGSSLHSNVAGLLEETTLFSGLVCSKIKSALTNSSSSLDQFQPVIHPPGLDPSTPALLQSASGKKNRTGSQHKGSSSSRSLYFGLESLKNKRLLEPFIRNKKAPVSSGSSSNISSLNIFDSGKHLYGSESSNWDHSIPHDVNLQPSFSNFNYPKFPTSKPSLQNPPPPAPLNLWWKDHLKPQMTEPYTAHYPKHVEPFAPSVHVLPEEKDDINLPQASVAGQGNGCMEDVMRKFENFKRFDTVQDHSDHHYSANGSSVRQPTKSWAKRIQEEWKILEKDLPDTIFVRVYESRMDLMRAVILGAEGTPYHNGLFFFDISFPSTYPNSPPQVHYHSGGLRLNPNLYNTGKVCLSLLNTWSGHKNEKWQPGVSTMLQVLVSIQGLILNEKPYFNEPGYAAFSGTASGERTSLKYNEDTFILSLRTMTYTMKRPPKYFEDLVIGHFFKHAKDILVACRAYMDGAQVGCLVKGGVQDVDAGDKSCSAQFKQTLSGYLGILVKEFSKLGVTDIAQFLPPPQPAKEAKRQVYGHPAYGVPVNEYHHH